MSNNDYLIEMQAIHKTFSGNIRANVNCSLAIQEGEIHAVVGENGAGKSTLMNILFGLYTPDEGCIRFRGKDVAIQSPRIAKNLGIEMVHQHFMLVPSFTALQNIMLGYEPKKGPFINKKQAEKEIISICKRYGLHIPLQEKVKNLSIGLQQRVEIVKALFRGANILILDEPTAVLTPLEADELFSICFEMVKKQKTILFISHKLKEVMKISHRITIMRRGSTIQTIETSSTNEKALARAIIGADRTLHHAMSIIQEDRAHAKTPIHPQNRNPVLEITNLTVLGTHGRAAVKQLSLTVHAGEICGIAGVEGNGQRELFDAISGITPIKGGSISLFSHSITTNSVSQRRNKGLRYIPEDRLSTGLCINTSLYENMFIDQNDRCSYTSNVGIIQWDAIRMRADEYIKEYSIAASSCHQKAKTLSGGNMQKVVVARELTASPTTLLVAHPTRGVDIGSADFIYQKLLDEKAKGVAILLISADLDELLLLSDRLLVMYEGSIRAEFSPQHMDIHTIGMYMTGSQGAQHD